MVMIDLVLLLEDTEAQRDSVGREKLQSEGVEGLRFEPTSL